MRHFMVVAAGCMLCALAGAKAGAAVIDASTFSGSVAWTVTDALVGPNNQTGSSAVTLPGSGVVSSTMNSGNGIVNTAWTFTHGVSSESFAATIEGSSGLGTTKATLSFAFTTTQWSAFNLTAHAHQWSLGGCHVTFHGVTVHGAFSISSPILWVGDIPMSPDLNNIVSSYTRSGLLAPGTYSFEFEDWQVMNAKYSQWIPQSSAATALLTLQAVDPALVPLPPAVWVGLLMAGPMVVRAARRVGRRA